MTNRDRLLAIIVAVSWGANFVAIHFSLEHYPPMFLIALRFAIIAIPTLIFVPWPKVKVIYWLGYGLGFGVLQFVFLYWGMASGMPTGLASLVLQASAPFTVLLAAIWLREKISARQAIGILVALLGLAAIAVYRSQVAAIFPVLLTLAGALGWAMGNIANRQAQPGNPFHLALWMSVIPPIPMFVLAMLVEGPDRIWQSLATAFTIEALPANLGLLYTVLLGTIVGTGLWTTLMKRYPSSTVAPFSLLVPVSGLLAAWLILGEVPGIFELVAGVFVVGGVLFASTQSASARLRARREAAERERLALEVVDSR